VAVGELLLQLAGQTEKGRLVFVWLMVGETSGAYRCWILWKLPRRGTGTKTMMAFLPWPTSTCYGRIVRDCP
jgi:hypothetical protein